jgi:hypothetical protein
MKKILWLDLETTDSDTKRGGGVHEISYILDIDGEVVVSKTFKCAPFKNDLINAKSLEVCGVDYKTISNYPPATDAFIELIKDIHPHKKVVIGGFNNSIFDNPYFQGWFFKCRNELKRYDINIVDYIHFDPLDVRVLALNKMLDKRDMIFGFKLADVAKLLDIDVEETSLHGAKYDIELTRKIYYSL